MEKNIKGIIQIIHGMCEYKKRYIHFIKYFEKSGWKVEILDHIHHGENVRNKEEIGIFKNDFNDMIENQINFTKELKKKYKNLPFIIFGHSMGSFIAQEHMKRCGSLVDGYIFCGSCYKQKFLWSLGEKLSYLLDRIYKNKRANIIRKMIFLNSNGKIKKEYYLNENSWLSRDIDEVKKYSQDKNCGFTYSSSFYKEFFIFLNRLYDKDKFDNILKGKPIFIISGSMDPVGLYGKGVKDLKKFYEKMDFKNIAFKLYKDARHELHNEINRDEVFRDIENWIEKIICKN
ncbi:alpha/beta fold hydrolase [Fusobacterium sp.]|uniref:alpha/beta fold hydrolase n=1 Tax=Fusobacterium sp. TaxID=68766 RepID=UPI0026093200|nr:alpha/beta fold hydrolase [Fusobacterium sp.]